MVSKKAEWYRNLGSTITKARTRKGITLEKLAYGVGISKGNLSEIEAGKRDPRYSTLKVIAEGLGLTLSQLLKEL